MREIGILEAKTNLSALITQIEAEGEAVLITRHGKPVAKLSAATSRESPLRPRKLAAEDLAERFRRRRESQPDNPELDSLTGDDLKKMARE